MNKINWKKIGFEFLSIFIAVISAFALSNWNENRREAEAANKILAEIANGLEKDIEDVRVNMRGHKEGINACDFWRDLINDEINEIVDTFMFVQHYFDLTRDYISIQNISGYETLKSKGLELIEDDSLRYEIITLYEFDYNVVKKFEEEYQEMQYHKSYFKEINKQLAPSFKFDQEGGLTGINLPLGLNEKDKNILLSYLWKIKVNRNFIIRYYSQTEQKLMDLHKKIETKLNQ